MGDPAVPPPLIILEISSCGTLICAARRAYYGVSWWILHDAQASDSPGRAFLALTGASVSTASASFTCW